MVGTKTRVAGGRGLLRFFLCLAVATLGPAAWAAGPREGIVVHGVWTVVVKNADGSVASQTRFENALVQGSGDQILNRLLSRASAVGFWGIELLRRDRTPVRRRPRPSGPVPNIRTRSRRRCGIPESGRIHPQHRQRERTAGTDRFGESQQPGADRPDTAGPAHQRGPRDLHPSHRLSRRGHRVHTEGPGGDRTDRRRGPDHRREGGVQLHVRPLRMPRADASSGHVGRKHVGHRRHDDEPPNPGAESALATRSQPAAWGASRPRRTTPNLRLLPAKPAEPNRDSAGGRHEGIKVHGHWVIDVRNPDGSLAQHRDFENALTLFGAQQLAAFLARHIRTGDVDR